MIQNLSDIVLPHLTTVHVPKSELGQEAAAYDTWLNEKVGASLAGLADGSNAIIPAKEWKHLRDQKRRAL